MLIPHAERRRIMKLIIRWLIVALAVAAAAWLVPGIQVTGTNGVITVIVMALVLGLVNAIIRPLLVLLSCGCIVATFGLFMLVINAVTFWLASWITSLGFNLRNRSFTKLLDYTPEEIRFLINLSIELKAAKYSGYEQPRLKGKNIALIFEKTSTRTRCASEVAATDPGAPTPSLGPG